MSGILSNRTYRHLLGAQVIALVGTGLATVALGLLAFELAGDDAGIVLGTALTIKMIAFVAIAPVASALSAKLPRRGLLVCLDLVRAGVALSLPFVTEVWQIYILIFVLQSASAGFTPAFQATIPDVLPDEKDYTKALSLSRLAYDLESLVSPVLAAALLTVMSFHSLFAGTAVGFIASAALVVSVTLPARRASETQSFADRLTRGLRVFLATPRLRGLLAVSAAVAASGAMVIVNTVVMVQGSYGLSQSATALALATYGGGSMTAALLLPRILGRFTDRATMLTGIALLVPGLAAGIFVPNYSLMLPVWFVLGFGYSMAQTPSGRLLRRSSNDDDRPALFAAHFALSHACWLVTYSLAGWLGATAGIPATFAILGGLTAAAVVAALNVWPVSDPENLAHSHRELDSDHPHWGDGSPKAEGVHSHSFVIDKLHRKWPVPAK